MNLKTVLSKAQRLIIAGIFWVALSIVAEAITGNIWWDRANAAGIGFLICVVLFVEDK
jgi:hypothetical protein